MKTVGKGSQRSISPVDSDILFLEGDCGILEDRMN